jgi:hypothetical protein
MIENSSEPIKETTGNRSTSIFVILAIATLIVGLSTAAIVHYTDTMNTAHNAMVSDAMQKKAIHDAATSAAMKQAETDKMAAGDAMTHGSAMAK